MSSPTNRQIVLAAAVAAAGIVWLRRRAGSCLRHARRSPPARRARIAVVGCGGWTQGWHLPNIANRDDAVLVALVDPSDHPGDGGCMTGRCETMDALVAKYGVPRYRSLDALLVERRDEIDGVLVAAPHTLHCSIGLTVLRNGLHLLLEKPMTTNVSEARAPPRLLFLCTTASPHVFSSVASRRLPP